VNRARELMRQGDFERALQATDALLLERPDDVESLLLHSEVLFRLYRSDEMIPHLEHAIRLQPDRFEAHANLTFALRFAGRLDEAEREAQWCLARQPEHAAVRRVLAEIRRDQGDHTAALTEVQAALRAAPQDLECRLLEADLLLFARDFEAAYQGLLPLQEQHGHKARYLSVLSRAAQLSGRSAEAQACRAALQRLKEAK
jgi:predicted Zn-dependent protease